MVIKKIIIALFFIVISFLGLELFFQFTKVIRPTLTEYNQDYGTKIKSDFQWIKFKEGFYLGKTTQEGILHEPEAITDTTPQLKIGLFGDSFVAGDDVFDRHHFGVVFEDSLRKHFPKETINVINFGRGNFSLPSSYYYYKNFSPKFDLDYVIYFLEFRDYQPSAPRFVKYYSLENNQLTDYLKGENNIQFKTLKFLQKTFIGSCLSKSTFLALLSRDIYAVKSRGVAKKFFEKFRSWEILLGLKTGEENNMWLNPTTANGEISDYTKFVINELTTQSKPKVIFVTRHHPVKVPDLDNYLETNNFSYFSLTEVFDETTIIKNNKDGHFFKASQSYGGHFNHNGHEATGKFLAEKFIALYDRKKIDKLR